MNIFVRVKTEEQLKAVKDRDIDCTILKSFGFGIPADGVVADNFDELAMIMEPMDRMQNTGEEPDLQEHPQRKKRQMICAGEFLYSYNKEAIAFFRSLVPDIEFIAPQELTLHELKKLEQRANVEFIYKVYGHQALMITNQCFYKNYAGCKAEQGSHITFKNENGVFYQIKECFAGYSETDGGISRNKYPENKAEGRKACVDPDSCRNIIYNGLPTYMLDKLEEFMDERKGADEVKLLIDFTIETARETEGIINILKKALHGAKPEIKLFTRGHYYRGIE